MNAMKLLILLLAALLAPLTALASWYWPFGEDGLAYDIRIDGADASMRNWFHHLKLDEKPDSHPPKTLDDLDQEGARLAGELKKALAAKGYFDAVVEYGVEKIQRPRVLFQITQGARYRLRAMRLDWEGGELATPDVKRLPVQPGQPVDMGAINQDAQALEKAIGKDACLLSLTVAPVLELTAGDAGARLSYRVKHGPRAHFGVTQVQGNDKVGEAAIRRLIAWKPGECFTEAAITKTRSALIATQLFSTVKVTPENTVDSGGKVITTLHVTERVERTFSTGVNYATDQGFGVKFGWEHRNFLGDAEKVNMDALLAEQEQSLSLTERDPGFLRDDQALVLSSSIDRQDTDAYTSQSINAALSVERHLLPHLDTSAGAGYLLTRSDDILQGNQNFGLLFAPFIATYDTRDNAQDARKGVYVRGAFTPYVDTFDLGTDFFKGVLTGQTYLSSEIAGKPTVALRVSLGTIDGAPSSSLPSELRFYAGGGGSVRGYSYQSLSPRFNGTSVGGGSLVEISAELRVRFTEEVGGVIFLDGGNAYNAELPNFTHPLYYGAGAGVRYYSPLGPLRFDVGLPLNGHDIDGSGVDAKGVQVYVSIGQAF